MDASANIKGLGSIATMQKQIQITQIHLHVFEYSVHRTEH